MKEEKETDKKECFAWLSSKKCNALAIKKCQNCSFYQHYSQVKDYKKFLPKEYQNKLGKKEVVSNR